MTPDEAREKADTLAEAFCAEYRLGAMGGA